MQSTQNFTYKLLLFYFGLINISANAMDQRAKNWSIKKMDNNTCIAQYALRQGVWLETKKLTIPVKDMGELQAYKVTINDKVVMPVNKPNLVDTSCNCIRVRDMDILKADEVNLRIDGVTNKEIDVSIKMQIKDIPQALEELHADHCRKPSKNLALLFMPQ